MQKTKIDYSKIRKRLPLILCILSLSYCMWWLEAPSHIEQIEDDQYVGKTLLIYPTAGKFVSYDYWFFGKKTGDSWFKPLRSIPNELVTPLIYKIVGKYRKVNHGSAIMFAGDGLTKYLVEPIVDQIDKRLFFFSLPRCDEQTNLTDPDTGIKIDFVCD